MKSINAVNAYTNEILASVPVDSPASTRKKIAALSSGFTRWSQTPLSIRIGKLGMIIGILSKEKESLARDISLEIGRPIKESVVSIDMAIDRVRYAIEHCEEFLAEDTTKIDDRTLAKTNYVPKGVVGVISSWNYPINIPLWSILPALLCGNTVIFKPSEMSLLSGLNLKRIMIDAGIEEDVFCVAIGGPEIGKIITKDISVKMISFTGKYNTGKDVSRDAADSLKTLILELGGGDAMVVLGDADIKQVCDSLVWGLSKNSGQACNSVRKIFIHESIETMLIEQSKNKLGDLKVGNPFEDGIRIGPLKDKQQVKVVKNFIEGREIICGGTFVGDALMPTLIKMNLIEAAKFIEEFLAPIAIVSVFNDLNEVIKVINGYDTGLTCSVWTKDMDYGEKIGRKIDCFTIGINKLGGTMDQCPWGGRKKSGTGFLFSKQGFRNFCDIQNIVIRK